MTYTAQELATLSGDKEYKQAPVGGQYYDTITLGKDGKFYLAYYSQPKNERKDPDTLGDSVTLTILKIRRKLSKWENNAQVLESVEYDAGVETVPTTQGDLSEKDAKARGAKVALVLYCLLNGTTVKLTVTGGSLYNPDDLDDMRLYTYLQLFEEDEHTFMYETRIGAKVNTYVFDGVEKTNYQMTFKRGTSHTNLDAVGSALVVLPATLEENDARDLKWLGSSKPAPSYAETAQKAGKPIEYPSDEINPSDIPF